MKIITNNDSTDYQTYNYDYNNNYDYDEQNLFDEEYDWFDEDSGYSSGLEDDYTEDYID